MNHQKRPPLFIRKFLTLFVNAQYLEEVEGDLEELYAQRVATEGTIRANLHYVKDVFQTLRPYGVRNSGLKTLTTHSPYVMMLRSNLKISFRSLMKHKGFTLINVVGLAIGVTSCIFLTRFIADELSFDKQFANGDRIYRMLLDRKEPDNNSLIAVVPHSFAGVLPKDVPEVERATSMIGPFDDMMISYKDVKKVDHRFLEQGIFATDSNFFKIFSFHLLAGNRKTMLQQTKSMVLTASTARQHFGTTDALGKIIHMSGNDFTVTGVCEDPPDNSHFTFRILISMHTLERFNLQNFNRPNAYCYVMLKPGADVKAVESKLPVLVNLYAAADYEKVNQSSWADHVKAGFGFYYFFCPLQEIYLHPGNICDFKPSGNIVLIRILIAIDILIFLIACINFINLSTARSATRAKEVGVRKVIGSDKLNLIVQFLTESFIVSFIAVALGATLAYFLLPQFNALTWKTFQFNFNTTTIIIILLVTVSVGFISGIYPAFMLSSFKPELVLKGRFISSAKGKWIRNSLVVFQFSVATMLIISTMIIYQQMKFINEKDLGYDREELLLITGDFHMKTKFTRNFIEEVKQIPQVMSAAGSLSMVSDDWLYKQQYRSETMPDVNAFHTMIIGDNFAEVMGFEKVAGRLFAENTNDSLSVILNESAVKAFGLKDPIGKTITYIEQTYGSGERTDFKIIGVVKDFHFTSLHLQIDPLVMQSNEIIFSRASDIVVRLHPNTERAALAAIGKKWRALALDAPFEFKFVNHLVDTHYKKERQIEKIVTIFAGLSILVACLGLFGLSAYTTASRKKEISIRKITGASTVDVLVLLSKGFTKPIIVSFIIAVPLSLYLMEKWWLQLFAFKTEISFWGIAFVGIGILFVAWATVAFQCIKTALVPPATVLKND